MIDDLQARFLPQFMMTAKLRVERVRDIATRRDHGALHAALRELHALVGEAGLLGLGGVLALARAAEAATHRAHGSRSDADVRALEAALDELATCLELVSSHEPGRQQ